jgi:hypothetical protein
MESPENIRFALAHETGTENYWKVFPGDNAPMITDGVKRMADMCEAFWLVTAIVLFQSDKKVKSEPFQVWKLKLAASDDDNSAVIICEDGKGVELARQELSYTDFPLPDGITLFLEDGILMLSSER